LVEQLAVTGAREVCTEAGGKHSHFLGIGVCVGNGLGALTRFRSLLRHDRALGSSRPSEGHTPRHREIGRPPAAQFTP
jgi:hypothetical protein